MKTFLDSTYERIIFHMICWVAYLAYEVLFTILIYHINVPFINYAFFYTCNISLFYFHFHVLDRYLRAPKPRYFHMSLMILIGFIFVMATKALWDYSATINAVPPQQFWARFKMTLALDLSRTFQFIFLSTVIWASINFGRFRRDTEKALLKSALADKANTELKYEVAQAQNAFLKQQINPHLLFNTLNAIYNTVYHNAPKDSEAVLLLSEIMRYSYEEPDSKGLVALESELYQLKNLIKLNVYRFRDTVQLDYRLNGDANNHRIIPLVLLTLTENMFKHGDLQQSPGSLSVTINENGQLTYTSKNRSQVHGETGTNSHVGLKNTKLRLDYAYPGNYQLDINQTEELFTVNLHINLAYERSDH